MIRGPLHSRADKPPGTRRQAGGAAVIEWLVAVPVVLLVGLGVTQWALVIQARQALHYAAGQAVRHAVRDHGYGAAINAGLASGLSPFWLVPTAQAEARLATGLSEGWLWWERTHPDTSVFVDFAEPARNRAGDPIAGDIEIPNDSLRYRSRQAGARSGVSIQDANRFQLELTYGVVLSVPLINALTVRVMEILDGCREPDNLLLVTTRLGRPEEITPRPWTCGLYRLPEQAGGAARWRLPVTVRAEGWMHSALRRSAAANSNSRDGEATVGLAYQPPPVVAGPDVFSAPPPAPAAGSSPGARGNDVSVSVGRPPGQGGDAMGPPAGQQDSSTAPAEERPGWRPAPITQPGQCTAPVG